MAGPTGVPGETIPSLARELVDGAPAVVYGRVGTSTQAFGSLCQWAINLVNLVNGALDREGGAMFPTPAIDLVSGPARIGRGAFGRWRSRVRGLPEFVGELPVATLGDEILTPGPGQVRGLLTVAGNPVLSTPNGARLDEALGTLDTYIAVDPYLNETTRHAHLILPPVSPLSRLHYALLIHPRDAARREIRPGARVAVRSRVGEVTVPAELSDDVMPGVVCLPHGFGHGRRGVRLAVAQERAGASLNDLTDPELLDGLSGNAALSGVPVTVAPASD